MYAQGSLRNLPRTPLGQTSGRRGISGREIDDERERCRTR